MDQFHLLRPWALVLLIPAVLLWLTSRSAANSTRRWARVIEPDLLKLLTVGGPSRWRLLPHDLLLAGWIVATLAIAGPSWQREPSPFADAERPVMIVLRVAPSMMTTDLAPTRLDRARQKIADLLKAHDGMPAGLIAYSGSAHLVLPPTPDRDIVLSLAQSLSPAIMPREGDRLDDALALADRILKDGGQGGSILVVAELGRARSNEPINDQSALHPARDASRADAPAVGRGAHRAHDGGRHRHQGAVPPARDRRRPAGRAWRGRALAGCGLLADAPDGAAGDGLVPPRLGAAMKRLVLVLALVSWQDLWSTPDQRGQRLMEAGHYAEAAAQFADPMRRGVAQFRAGDFKAAAETFGGIDTADAAYDQGTALIMLGKYDEAIKRFDRALVLRPGWADAEANRTLAAAAQGEDQHERQRCRRPARGRRPDRLRQGQDQRQRAADRRGQRHDRPVGARAVAEAHRAAAGRIPAPALPLSARAEAVRTLLALSSSCSPRRRSRSSRRLCTPASSPRPAR